MSTTNPFSQEMVNMKVPEGLGSNIVIAGFMLSPDQDGCVQVPRSMQNAMESHGLSEITTQAQASKGKK